MKKIIWVLLILVVLIGGYYLLSSKKSNTNIAPVVNQDTSDKPSNQTVSGSNIMSATSSTPKTTTATTTTTTSTGPKTYTLVAISSHSSSSSCWSAISGKVYDLTSFITKHPGGSQAILAICGKDGSELFDGQHGMDPRAKGLLPNFYLGYLSN